MNDHICVLVELTVEWFKFQRIMNWELHYYFNAKTHILNIRNLHSFQVNTGLTSSFHLRSFYDKDVCLHIETFHHFTFGVFWQGLFFFFFFNLGSNCVTSIFSWKWPKHFIISPSEFFWQGLFFFFFFLTWGLIVLHPYFHENGPIFI